MGLEAFSLVQEGRTTEQIAARICDAASAWLKGGRPSLALVFASAHFAPEYEGLLKDLKTTLKPAHLVGCSGRGVIGTGREFEDRPIVSVLLLRHPSLRVTVCHVRQNQIEESNGPGFWHLETDMNAGQPEGILLLGDPFTVAIEKLARGLNEAYPQIPIVGGLASGSSDEQVTHLFQDATVHAEGALLVFIEGAVRLETVVSQGCKPIGEPMIVTRSEGNLIQEIAGRPAVQVLNEVVAALPPQERKRVHHNLFAGLAVNEYVEEFRRGDFLIRNLVGADHETGALAVAAPARTGQTIQFQMRDAEAAREDMVDLLRQAQQRFKGRPVRAGLLCSCNGRGEGLFGGPNHDPAAVENILGAFPVAGFFCNGEIGPIGARVFVHGYTCAMGLFLDA